MKSKRIMFFAAFMLAGMSLFEILKQLVIPGIATWASNAMTIVVVTAAGSVAAYFIMKRYDGLETTLKAETSGREKAERRLMEVRASNAQILHDYQMAQERVRLLSGLLPICVTCDKIRDDKGSWETLGRYIERHPEAAFSRTICDQCLRIIYSEEELSESDRSL